MKNQFYGFIAAIMYVLLSSAQSVYAGNITQHFSPIALSFFCFAIVTVTALSAGLAMGKISFSLLKENAQTYFMINLTTLGLWLGFLISVKYIEPALAVIIFGVMGPAIISLISPLIRPGFIILKSEKQSSLLYVILFALLVYAIFAHHTAIQNRSSADNVIGIVCALIASLGTASFAVYVKKLFDKKLSVIQVMPFRFLMLMIVTALFLTKNDWKMLADPHYLFVLFSFAWLGCLLPMYFGQLSVSLLEPIVFSFIAAMESFFTLLLQGFDKRLHESIYSTILVTMVSMISIYVVVARVKHEKRKLILSSTPAIQTA